MTDRHLSMDDSCESGSDRAKNRIALLWELTHLLQRGRGIEGEEEQTSVPTSVPGIRRSARFQISLSSCYSYLTIPASCLDERSVISSSSYAWRPPSSLKPPYRKEAERILERCTFSSGWRVPASRDHFLGNTRRCLPLLDVFDGRVPSTAGRGELRRRCASSPLPAMLDRILGSSKATA